MGLRAPKPGKRASVPVKLAGHGSIVIHDLLEQTARDSASLIARSVETYV
jgi:hypothetical protein